jgi:hypothetical protein
MGTTAALSQPGTFKAVQDARSTWKVFLVSLRLIGRGAVETLRSPEGETLSEIAQKAGHREIALILDGAAGRDEARS